VNAARKWATILGFGRSGTTWLSDIVSKSLGAAILFEPLHPEVLPDSQGLSYRSELSPSESGALLNHLTNLLEKQNRSPWLLRNHLPGRVHEIDPGLNALIWREVDIIGMKSIRAALAPAWVAQNIGSNVVFIVRHPLAVVSSILRRENFWEFGWPRTWEVFIANALSGRSTEISRTRELYESSKAPEALLDRVATMWAITHAIAIPQVHRLGLLVTFYEDLYQSPFRESKEVLGYLGHEGAGVMPQHLFTPSMTTMRTLHGQRGLKTSGGLSVPASFFWKETLSRDEQRRVLDIVDAYGVHLYRADGTKSDEYATD